MVRNFRLVAILMACGAFAVTSPEDSGHSAPGARAYLLTAQKDAEQLKQNFTGKQLLEQIAIVRARTGDFEGAVQIVQGIYPMGGAALKEIGHGMAAAGRAAEAKALAKNLPGGEGDTLRAMVAEAEAQAGSIDAALMTAKTIGASEVKRYAMQSIAAEQVKRGHLVAAREIFRAWPEPQPGPPATPALLADRVTAAIAEAQTSNDVQAALKTASSIRDMDQEIDTYFDIAFHPASTGDIAHAEVALVQLQNVLGPHRASYPMVYLLAKLGRMPEALKMARAVLGSDPEARNAYAKSLTTIAIFEAEGGDAKAARKTVAEIGVNYRKPGDMTDFLRREALLDVAHAQTNTGDPVGAIETLRGILPDPSPLISGDPELAERAYAWAKAGEFPKALAVVNQMHKGSGGLVPRERTDTIRAVAAVQANTGQDESAAQWAKIFPDPVDRAAAFLGIAEGLLGKTGIESRNSSHINLGANCSPSWRPRQLMHAARGCAMV